MGIVVQDLKIELPSLRDGDRRFFSGGYLYNDPLLHDWLILIGGVEGYGGE